VASAAAVAKLGLAAVASIAISAIGTG